MEDRFWLTVRRIPKWYQCLSLFAIVIPLSFNATNTTQFLTKLIRIDVAEYLWPKEYAVQLFKLSLLGRVGLACYGLVLLGIALFLYKFKAVQDKPSPYRSFYELFVDDPIRTRIHYAGIFIDALVCVQRCLLLACATVLESPTADSGWIHVRIQAAVMRRLLSFFVFAGLCPALLTFLYHWYRDVERFRVGVRHRIFGMFYVSRAICLILVSALFSRHVMSPLFVLWTVVHAACWILSANHFASLAEYSRVMHAESKAFALNWTLKMIASISLRFYPLALLVMLGLMIVSFVIEVFVWWMTLFLGAVWIPTAVITFNTDVLAGVALLMGGIVVVSDSSKESLYSLHHLLLLTTSFLCSLTFFNLLGCLLTVKRLYETLHTRQAILDLTTFLKRRASGRTLAFVLIVTLIIILWPGFNLVFNEGTCLVEMSTGTRRELLGVARFFCMIHGLLRGCIASVVWLMVGYGRLDVSIMFLVLYWTGGFWLVQLSKRMVKDSTSTSIGKESYTALSHDVQLQAWVRSVVFTLLIAIALLTGYLLAHGLVSLFPISAAAQSILSRILSFLFDMIFVVAIKDGRLKVEEHVLRSLQLWEVGESKEEQMIMM